MANEKKTVKRKFKKSAAGPENTSNEFNDISIQQGIEYLKNSYAYIEIRIDDASFKFQDIPQVIQPAPLLEDEHQFEYVYPIYDFGDRLLAAKDVMSGQSMLKMNYTIEKMIHLWSDKIQTKEQSFDEVKVYIDGHLFCLRKAFEVIINLTQNWVVMNFDPGEWGNRYLEILQKLYQKGFAYPGSAPRDFYRHVQKTSNNIITIPGKS